MIVPHTFATFLARVVELFRDPAAKDEQKTQFRALHALLKAGGVTVTTGGGVLRVNGETVQGAALEPLLRRLELHGVDEINVGQNPPPTQLFELVKALADAPGADDLPSRLRAAGADRIAVRTAAPQAPTSGGPRLDLGADGIVHGESMSDLPPPPVSTQAEAVTAPEVPEPAAEAEAPVDPIGQLERNPRVANASELLHAIGLEIEAAMRSRRPERAMRLIAGVARCEQLVPDGSQRRQYAIALKRVLTKPVLEALSQLVTMSGYREDAIVALQRAGAAGVEVLLDLLVAAPTVQERQAIFGALADMKEGTDPLVHMLSHNQWFVVRNVAELVGEMELEEAVPALAKQLDHEDERVRKAVALALAKIGSGAAAEPLRRALRDKSAAVRMQAALGVGGRKSTPLAMPLVVAMEEEEDADVERELILALGRIGSSDAVQALLKFAQPSGRLFGRKPTALRVAAVEALRVAATAAAVGMLQGLAEDSDKEVRSAAQEALKDLKR
ncbi:MAG TPA: HEAT repeat domain-containing protein [Gemmatimonadales bacterium]